MNFRTPPHTFRLCAALGLLSGCISSIAFSQAVYAQSEQPAPPEFKNLAEALAAAHTLEGNGIAISVDAARVKPPTEKQGANAAAIRLTPGAPVQRVARRYNRLVRAFGPVLAVAPPTMDIINTAPGKPDIYSGMPPSEAMTLLLATLTDSQWQAVTSEAGLSVGALTTDDQKMLFRAILPKEKLTIVPYYYSSGGYQEETQQDLTNELSSARIRISQTYAISYPQADNPGVHMQSSDIPPPPDAGPRFKITARRGYSGSHDRLYGITIRKTVDNVEKPGQLNENDPRLAVSIPVDGLKTINDLIERMAKATGIDLYADPRYGALSLTLVAGPGAAAPASSLLRAVALCTTGLYRRVGPVDEPHPAYILTDDIVGMAARQSLWYEFEQDGQALRASPVSQAAQSLFTRFGPRSVSSLGDDAALAATPAQKKENEEEESAFPPAIRGQFGTLSPAQQAAVQRVIERHNKVYTSQLATTNGEISMYPISRAELLLPALAGPVNLDLPIYSLFRETKEAKAARAAKEQAAIAAVLKEHPELATRPLKPVAPSDKPHPPHRAVLLSPSSVEELEENIAAMRALGLNELWLSAAFHRRGPVISDRGDGDTLLAAALNAVKETDIKVFPVVDIFAEEPTVAKPTTEETSRREAKRDRNLLGETSTESEAHLQERLALLSTDESVQYRDYEDIRPVPPVYDNPLTPGFREDCQLLMRRLTHQPGVTGIIWRGTDPPGYDAVRGGKDISRRLLGYNDAMRLAFVRKFHADPVDLYSENYYNGLADTAVPIQKRSQISTEYQVWKTFRREENLAFLHDLFTAAGTTPVLVKQRRLGNMMVYSGGYAAHPAGWYALWDGKPETLPVLRTAGEDFDLGRPGSENSSTNPGSPAQQAIRQSAAVIRALTIGDYLYEQREGGTTGMAAMGMKTQGFVLDLTETGEDHISLSSPRSSARTPHTLPEIAATLAQK